MALEAVFKEELQRHGVKIVPGGTDVFIVVTVTQNLTEYLGIAQIEWKEKRERFIERLDLIRSSPAAEASFALSLHKEFLFAQDRPMLDVFDNYGKYAYVLGLEEITHYESRDDKWQLAGTDSFPAHPRSQRELQGFYYHGIDNFELYLPGLKCDFELSDNKGWSCEAYQGHMPIRSVESNVLAGKKGPPWVSAAAFKADERTNLILTGKDGVARLYEEGSDPVAIFQGWGSEVDSIHSRCGSGWQVIVTGKGDWTTSDTAQAFEIQNHQARAVSQSVDFAGPIIVLHNPSWIDYSTIASTVAIVHNLQTGRYEAYRLTITCGN